LAALLKLGLGSSLVKRLALVLSAVRHVALGKRGNGKRLEQFTKIRRLRLVLVELTKIRRLGLVFESCEKLLGDGATTFTAPSLKGSGQILVSIRFSGVFSNPRFRSVREGEGLSFRTSVFAFNSRHISEKGGRGVDDVDTVISIFLSGPLSVMVGARF
jgi:hypothetical protein